MAGALELGRDDVGELVDATAKDTSVGGTSRSSKEPDMESLPPIGAGAELDLGHERSQYGGHGLAPALGHIAQALEVLLEGR